MSETKELLRRGVGEFEPMPDAFERVLVRRDRKQRNRRIGAGAVGVIVALATGIIFFRSMMSDGIPADPPVEPGPVPSGALTYARYGDIYVADPDGSNAFKIADATDDAECESFSTYSSPSWSPDGRYLAFERDCVNSTQTDVVITDPHGNAITEFPSYGWGFTWSPDSTRVVVWDPALRIGVYGFDGERYASLPEPTVTRGSNDAAPEWMPDGSALLLYGYAVVPLDGSAGHELSPGKRTYSPDGTRYAVDMGHTFAIYDADESRVSEASVRPDPTDPSVDAWSPDGERLASLTNGELNVVDVASGTVTALPEARAAIDDSDEIVDVLGFSPQGDRVLYATDARAGLGNTALWSIGVDSSDPRLLVAGTTDGGWRPR